jgi:hypothetical protein
VFFLGAAFLLPAVAPADSVNRSDPAAVAKYVLNSIQQNNLEALLEVMDKDQKQGYLPLTPENREALAKLVRDDLKKVGKRGRISELRKCTTLSGKPGVVARARKKGDEVYVIILAKENDIYSYENTLTLLKQAYNELIFIKKVQ